MVQSTHFVLLAYKATFTAIHGPNNLSQLFNNLWPNFIWLIRNAVTGSITLCNVHYNWIICTHSTF